MGKQLCWHSRDRIHTVPVLPALPTQVSQPVCLSRRPTDLTWVPGDVHALGECSLSPEAGKHKPGPFLSGVCSPIECPLPCTLPQRPLSFRRSGDNSGGQKLGDLGHQCPLRDLAIHSHPANWDSNPVTSQFPTWGIFLPRKTLLLGQKQKHCH